MRVAFFGTSEFAVPALNACAPHTVLVVSQPDRPSGRGMKLKSSPVKQRALEIGLPVETPEKCRAPEFVELLLSLHLDVLVVAAYGQILSHRVLESANRGGVNLHGSILPSYRGAAPIQRAILNGETETGVSLMQMDKGMDTGDIIDIQRTTIGNQETYGDLQARLADIAAQQIRSWLPKIVGGDYQRVPQNHDDATYAPKIERSEQILNLLSDARQELNRYRAFTPNPGAQLSTVAGNLKIHKARYSVLLGRPGEVLCGNPLTIGCGAGALELLEVQPAGRNRMGGTEFANGARWAVGTSILPTTVSSLICHE